MKESQKLKKFMEDYPELVTNDLDRHRMNLDVYGTSVLFRPHNETKGEATEPAPPTGKGG